ncbi:MAG: hypothetical protein SNJ79_08190, partial [Sphingomonadaceae bacterium]
DAEAVAWSGHARRAISAFVPLHNHDPAQDARFDGLEPADKGDPKTFEHLARDDRQVVDGEGRVIGVEALGVLKGDIDDLGALFAATLGEKPTFARWAELSRRVNAFFTIWVPSLCARDPTFRNIYTVFAGGDDFFFIGPWHTVIRFAAQLRADFRRYTAHDSEADRIHFSAGYVMAKPGFPVRQLAAGAEAALERAKGHGGTDDARKRKNQFALFDVVLPWEQWARVETIVETFDRRLGPVVADTDADAKGMGADGKNPVAAPLPSAYLYDLLRFSEMARKSADPSRARPEHALWRSRMFYQTRRFVERRQGRASDAEERRRQDETIQAMIRDFGDEGIRKGAAHFRVALFRQIYMRRD